MILRNTACYQVFTVFVALVFNTLALKGNVTQKTHYCKPDALFIQTQSNLTAYQKEEAFVTFKIKPSEITPEFNPKISDTDKNEIYANIEKLPLTFRKNSGQWDEKIAYQAVSPGWNAKVSFMQNELSFGFSREVENKKTIKKELASNAVELLVWNQEFLNGNKDVQIEGSGEAESNANYFIGNDKNKHVVNASDYRFLSYKNIYPSITFNYYSTGKNLKYDYVINPGGNIADIKIKNKGVKSISINKNNELEISTAWGILIEKMPESYQLIDGKKKNVSVKYVLQDNNSFGFKVDGSYDKNYALIIDPVNYVWGTFVGGNVNGDVAYLSGIDIDAAGNVYASGQCNAFFPTTPGAYDTSHNGSPNGYTDVFVFKLSANGSTLLYSTFIGGSNDDRGIGIAVSPIGEAFVCGRTASVNFPVSAGAFQNTFAGGTDVLVIKLNVAGNALLYSTYIGGWSNDEAFAIKIDNAGNAYVAGGTGSGAQFGTQYPTTAGAFDTSLEFRDGFITCLNNTGTGLVFSTFTGGDNTLVRDTIAFDIERTTSGELYVTGYTYGTETSAGAYQTTYGGGFGADAFAARFNANCSARIYNTYIGLTAFDEAYGISVNTAGEAFIVGYTYFGSDYPTTAGSYNATPSSGGFLTKINATGTALIYSTMLFPGKAYSVEVNDKDEVYVIGDVQFTTINFPGTYCAFDQSENGQGDFFIAKINAAGSTLLYFSYFGGSQPDYGNGPVAFGRMNMVLTGDCKDEVYVGGTTHSPIMPTTPGVYQQNRGIIGGDQPFIFNLKPKITVDFSSSATPTCSVPVQFTDLSAGPCGWDSAWVADTWAWDFGDGGTSTQQNPIHTYNTAGTYTVKLKVTCPRDSIVKTINVSNTGCLPCVINADTVSKRVSCPGGTDGEASVNATGGAGNYNYTWSTTPIQNNDTAKGLTAGLYTVTVSDGSCSRITAVLINKSPTITVTASASQNAICPGSTVTLSASGTSTYTWTPTTGLNSTTGSPVTATIQNNITYKVVGVNLGGCKDSTTVSITTLPVPTITYSGTQTVCTGGNTSITASGGVSYTWLPITGLSSSTGATVTITPTTTTTYTTIATGANNCTTSDSVTITVNAIPVASAGNDTSFCAGKSVQLNATGGTSYSWSPVIGLNNSGINNPIASPPSTTKYVVTASNGPCSSKDSLIISINPNPVANAGSDVTVILSNSTPLNASGGVSYTWTPTTGLSNPNINNPIAKPTATTTYVVQVTNANGCVDTDTVTVFVDIKCGGGLFIPTAFSPNGDTQNEIFRVRGACLKSMRLSIFNRWGELVFTTNDIEKGWDGTISGSAADSGVYAYSLEAELIDNTKVSKSGNVTLLR